MVVGVVPDIRVIFGTAADNDAACTAAGIARGGHGVFAVVVTALLRQASLVVAEVLAVVLRVDVVLVGQDAVDNIVGLLRQGIYCAGGTLCTRLVAARVRTCLLYTSPSPRD